MTSTYLVHHGIKGMKWGVRRYQNEDGTLTELGKQRYGSDVTKVKPSYIRQQYRNAGESGVRSQSTEIGRKALTEAEAAWKNSKQYKQYKEALDEYRNEGAPQVGNDILIPKDDMERLNGLRYLSDVVYGYCFTEALDKYTDALLKDLGYDVTEAGQKYIWDTLMHDPKTSNVLVSELNDR